MEILHREDIPTDQLILCGEAAVSDVTPQIIANATGKKVNCVSEPFVSALGATMLARGLLNQQTNSLQNISRQYAPASVPFQQNEDRTIYQEMLHRYMEPFTRN